MATVAVESMEDLAGKAALVTGGAQGIGLGIVRELARQGSRVVIADRNEEQAHKARDEIVSTGHEAIAVTLDVTDELSIHRALERVMQRFTRIDILVNNAGIHCEELGKPSTVEHFERCFDVNLYSVWRMVQALLPHFIAQGAGTIINIASIDGRKPWADTPAYSASKAALINLTRSLAAKLGAHGINVKAVCPGGVMTAMADQFTADWHTLADDIIQSRALKRALTAEDIGQTVVFLASARARKITGQALNVDGGTVMS
jgi:NAD(P)-dependent dehydrogenase (short-subunit alcohol dehydrogenase family)